MPTMKGFIVYPSYTIEDNKAYIKLTDTLEVNDGYRIVGDVDYGNSVSRIIKGSELVKKAFPKLEVQFIEVWNEL